MAIARLAERQHGLVTLTQLQFRGLSRSAVAKRAREGRLTDVEREPDEVTEMLVRLWEARSRARTASEEQKASVA